MNDKQQQPNTYLQQDGTVRDDAVVSRELLYTGLNGSRVERIEIESGSTVVYKITPDLAQAAREARVYEGVLPLLPSVYPALLGYSGQPAEESGGRAWHVYEDVGTIDHTFHEQAAAELIGHMARWHAVPTDGLPLGSGRGPKPDYEEIVADLLMELGWNWRGGPTAGAAEREAAKRRAAAAEAKVRGAASSIQAEISGNAPAESSVIAVNPKEVDGDEPLVFGLPEQLVLSVYGQMKQQPPVIVYVLSHGDLHPGNFGTAQDGALTVLDWEHVHRNSPYWDLYHALDMSHPMFPRSVGEEAWERLLSAYWEQAKTGTVPAEREAFMREYCLFSAVFSLWMLQLIDGDLAAGSGPWPYERLLGQRAETRAAFLRCANWLQQATA